MKRMLTYPIAVTALVMLTSGLGVHAGAEPSPSDPLGAAGTADPLPLKGTLSGVHVSRTPVNPPVVLDRFEASGQATFLGRFDVVIVATVDFGVRPVRGAGTYTLIAANGDRIVADHTGFSALVEPGTVLITEHATIDPARSTGRFAGAQGTFTVERLADAATGVGGITSGSLEGAITLGSRP